MFWLFTRERYDIEMRMKQKLLGNVRYDPRLALRGELVHFMEPHGIRRFKKTGTELARQTIGSNVVQSLPSKTHIKKYCCRISTPEKRAKLYTKKHWTNETHVRAVFFMQAA